MTMVKTHVKTLSFDIFDHGSPMDRTGKREMQLLVA
jgi:hypothetical protein